MFMLQSMLGSRTQGSELPLVRPGREANQNQDAPHPEDAEPIANEDEFPF